jgi:hypothetical protein
VEGKILTKASDVITGITDNEACRDAIKTLARYST